MATLNINFLSKSLGRQTNVMVVLPSLTVGECIENDMSYYKQGMKYQTLWLLHGFTGDQEDYIKFSNIVRYAEENKLAVVMPAAYNEGYTDQEYGAKYMHFVSHELMTFLQAYLPLSNKREDNFIGGLSMGGAGTMKIALAYPEKYSYALCMSGVCTDLSEDRKPLNWFGNDPYAYNGNVPGQDKKDKGSLNDAFYQAAKNIQFNKELPNFIITCGSEDFALERCEKAQHYLEELNYSVYYEEVPGFGHEWDFWDLTLRKALYEWFPLKRKPIY